MTLAGGRVSGQCGEDGFPVATVVQTSSAISAQASTLRQRRGGHTLTTARLTPTMAKSKSYTHVDATERRLIQAM